MKKISSALITALTFILLSCNDNPGSGSSGTPEKSTASSGEDVYKRTCVSCHMANGEGLANVYPPLAKSDCINDKEKTIMQLINGSTGEMTVNGKKYNGTMPPQQLNDEEIADVLTYVYNSFGNSCGTVTVDDVKAARAKH